MIRGLGPHHEQRVELAEASQSLRKRASVLGLGLWLWYGYGHSLLLLPCKLLFACSCFGCSSLFIIAYAHFPVWLGLVGPERECTRCAPRQRAAPAPATLASEPWPTLTILVRVRVRVRVRVQPPIHTHTRRPHRRLYPPPP